MDDWRTMAIEGTTASTSLLHARHWRAFTSRAYYTVFAFVVHALQSSGGVNYPQGLTAPSHQKLPANVLQIGRLTVSERRVLGRAVKRLYAYRIDADYRPAATFDRDYSRMVLTEYLRALAVLERNYGAI